MSTKDYKQVNILIPPEEYALYKREAQKRGLTVSPYLAAAVHQLLLPKAEKGEFDAN